MIEYESESNKLIQKKPYNIKVEVEESLKESD